MAALEPFTAEGTRKNKDMTLTDVINIERNNTRHIHLYAHGRAWGCCGRSAQLLHRLYPNLPCSEREIDDTGIRLPGMIIDPMTLQQLIRKLPPTEQTPTQITFELPII